MNSRKSFRVQGEPKDTQQSESPATDVTILNLLGVVVGDTSLAVELSQLFEIREFQLGDELLNYHLNAETQHSHKQGSHKQDTSDGLYLVCSGKVRLLGFDTTLGREVSTSLLSATHTFGADDLFCSEVLFYRAVAASECLIAKIKRHQLEICLKKIPQLKEQLQPSALERQMMTFLKTRTKLRSQKSQTIKRLLPYVVSRELGVGSGEWGVGNGELGMGSGKIKGEYPNEIQAGLIAQTDSFLYYLSEEGCSLAAEIMPILFTKTPPSLPSPPPSPPPLPLPNSPLPTPHSPLPTPHSPLPFIQQQSSSDCGAACLTMICQYWGKRFSINTLRSLAQVDRTGASLGGLAEACESLGFHTLAVRGSLSKLEEQSNPWIAHWQASHYVVVWQVKGNNVLISDPAIGKRQLSRSDFEASWTGFALLLEPTERLFQRPSEKISYINAFAPFWRYPRLLLQIVLASVLLQVFALFTPVVTQVVLDIVLPEKSFLTLNIFALGFLIFGIWRLSLVAVRQYLLDYIGTRVELSLTGRFINHTAKLPLQFFASRQVGDILSRVHENQKIQLFVTRHGVNTLLDALMALIYLGLMAYYNLQLTLLVLVLMSPIAILTFSSNSLRQKVSREIFQEKTAQNSAIVEIITGITTVKTASAERVMRWRWEERFASLIQARFRSHKLENNLQFINSLLNHIAYTGVFWYGATLVMQQHLSIGQFVAFNMFIPHGIKPILAMVGLYEEFQQILISLERLNDVFSTDVEENPQKPLVIMPPIQGEVRFENVTFRYNHNAERNTLQNITFAVKAGQTVAIIGPSGSGKSTLVNLLAGLYHPQSGRILIDGYDIATVSPTALRTQMGIVPQECFLFSGTILENITLWSSEYTEKQAIAVAKLAQADSFIQTLPLKYNTPVGERGSMLSGGQGQKIAIARALLRNPRILILDEATSSQDTESERSFQKNLARFNSYRTTFIVAHRMNTIRCANHILVLDRGIIVEQGTHQELIAIRGLYYHLIQQQIYM
ncbi:MAG: peptidase domain-containing ABC transporter [Scytonematopsis contorta HA4267-MV1]|jgi:ATP-binding cassette subfamily B protein|nr:peptidase domain-containing ABC transporter [Scytonematopsis contorta HA4267-MV1]